MSALFFDTLTKFQWWDLKVIHFFCVCVHFACTCYIISFPGLTFKIKTQSKPVYFPLSLPITTPGIGTHKMPPNFIFALGLSILIVVHSRRKKSLTWDGSAAAFLLGMVTFSSSLNVFTVVLLTFFLSSSKLTKFKADRKRVLEAEYEHSSERNYVQVLCNGLAGGVAVTLFQIYCESQNNACFDQVRWATVLLWVYIG
jgi:preprotein translocase subunit SecG